MKLCLLTCRGRPVEIMVVQDSHDFGEHGNHFHQEVALVEEHICHLDPQVAYNNSKELGGDPSHDHIA